MTPEQFKTRWESSNKGGGITFNDIADCARAWGLFATSGVNRIDVVVYRTLKYAQCEDAENYNTPAERMRYAGMWYCPYCGSIQYKQSEAAPLCCGEIHSITITEEEKEQKHE